MKPRNPSRQSLGLIVLSFATAGLSILSSQSAQGAAYDWIGATNATWDSGWTGSNVPTSSDDLSILGPLNAAGALNINVAASAFANSLNFTDTAAVTLTNTTSGANQTLTLQNGLTIGTGAVTNGSTTVNQGVSTTLGANQAWTIGTGGLTTNSAVNLSTFNLTKSGAGGFTLNGPLTGSGTITSNALNFGNATPNGSNGSNSGGFTGALNVGGLLGFNSPGSFNGADYYYNFSNAAVTFTVGGSTQWNAANGGANNDPGIAYINFGSLSSASGVGTLVGTTGGTVNTKGARYIVGTLNTDTSFGGVVSPSSLGTALTKVGTGTLTLTGTHTYAGIGTYGTFGPVPATTIRGGTLQLGDGTSGSLAGTGALTFQDSGRFNYQGQTAGSSQSLGTLTFAQGGGTVQSTSGSSGNTSLTFASLAARAAGATGNFVVSGGLNGSTNKIAFTTGPSTDLIIDKGYYFNGSDFAAYDSTGFVRALIYGTDGFTSAVDTIASLTHVKISATPPAQDDTSLFTLNLAGSGVSWSNNPSQTLTLSGGGLIKSGGGTAASISGGAGLTSGGTTELVVRTDTASDLLDLQTPILSTSTGGLTKAGAGTLTFSAANNAYTGATRINAGTMAISGTYVGSSAFTINNSATLNVTGTLTSTSLMTVGNGSGNGVMNVNSGATVTLGTTGGVSGLQISNSAIAHDTATGTVNVNGGTLTSLGDLTVGLGGSQSGKLIINSGTVNAATTVLKWLKLGQFDEGNGQIDLNGGNLNLNANSDIRFSTNGGSGISAINQNGGNLTSYSGNGTGTAGSAGDGLIDMQQGSTTIANNTYNLNSGTLTINAIISTNTNGTRTFNFNGGTLKAASGLNAANFLNLGAGNSRANIRNNSALIDTNGTNVTIASALQHSNISGDNATDGGLIKSGTGTLTLSGTSSFTGNLTINAGTVAAGTGQGGNPATSNLGALQPAVNRNITVNNTGILSLTGGNVLGTGGSTNTLSNTTLVVNAGGVVQTGSNAAGAGWWNKLGAITLNGGVIQVGSGADIFNFQGLALIGDVTVTGSTASTIGNLPLSDIAYNAVHLGQNATPGQVINFNVADVTADSAADLTISTKLINTSSFGIASGLSKSGAGTMVLSGVNSYTGSTTVNAGTLTLADDAGLKFVIGANGLSNKITGAGTASLSGDFTLDLTGAAIANGNSWTLVDTTSKSFTSTFTVVGFAQVSDVWTKIDGSNTWTFTEADGKLTLTVAGGGGYNAWKSANAGNQTADLDYDLDGVKNGVEYFMNSAAGFTTNPSVVSGVTRTVTWPNGGNIPASAYGSQFVVQISTDLVNWTDVPSGSLTTNTDGPGGSLTYTLTGTGSSFVRLKVTPN